MCALVVVAFGGFSVVHYTYIYATAHPATTTEKTARLTERKRTYETHISAAGHVFAIIISLPRFGMLW